MTEMTDPVTVGAPAPGYGTERYDSERYDSERYDSDGDGTGREPDEFPIVRPAHAARCTASAFIATTAVLAALGGWQAWGSYSMVHGGRATQEQLSAADWRTTLLAWAWLLCLVGSAVSFAAWLWRARANATRICAARHRLRARWVVGAWFVPVVNLWWPRVVLADVWRASNPDLPPRGADLRAVRAGRLIDVWWATTVLAITVELVAVVLRAGDGAVEPLFVVGAFGGGLAVLSAGSILYVMRRVDRWQTGREAIR